MPELPEAETIVRGLRIHLLNHSVQSMEFPKARFFRPQSEYPLEHFRGAYIRNIFRHGKSVIFELELSHGQHAFMVVRLGMTGQLLIERPADAHTHAIFHLNSKKSFSFRDQRQFGRIFFVKDWRPLFLTAKTKRLRSEGALEPGRQSSSLQPVPDPLEIDGERFVQLFYKRRGMIKSAVMSQQLIMGVGNIYADESLFAARIHPRQQLHRLSKLRLREYHAVLVKVLKEAITLGGSSISDFVDATNSLGEFQFEHKVYGRKGKPCLRRGCRGTIRRIVAAGRGTHFCPKCQRKV